MRAPSRSPLVWAAWAAVLVITIAALTAMLFAMLTPAPWPPCSSIDAESITEEAVEALRAEGWYPDPTDGYERLFTRLGASPRRAARE